MPRDIPNESSYSREGDYLRTPYMLDVEREAPQNHNLSALDPSYMEIHELILDSLQHYHTDRQAANSLGLLPATFSQWIARCGIALPASRIRSNREKRVNQYA